MASYSASKLLSETSLADLLKAKPQRGVVSVEHCASVAEALDTLALHNFLAGATRGTQDNNALTRPRSRQRQ
jgi:hypothetical protein